VREFTFSLDCQGGPEENVQISFGTDSNTNGILDLAECELTVGWDSGCWFVLHGDYLGRPDNILSKTVWCYNAVNDYTGMGACATFGGLPVRVAKLSNFFVGYCSRRIGASDGGGHQ